jgi:hypothetical protein
MLPATEEDFPGQPMNQRADAHPGNALRLVLLAESDGQEISRISLVILTCLNLDGLRLGDLFALGCEFL